MNANKTVNLVRQYMQANRKCTMASIRPTSIPMFLRHFSPTNTVAAQFILYEKLTASPNENLQEKTNHDKSIQYC